MSLVYHVHFCDGALHCSLVQCCLFNHFSERTRRSSSTPGSVAEAMRAVLAVVLICSLAALVAPSGAELLVSFDEASASSFDGGDLGAQKSLSDGSGY